MTDDRSQRARAAAEVGTATRREAMKEAMNAFDHDAYTAFVLIPIAVDQVTRQRVSEARTCLTACMAHLDELARLIAQRDGYADPRQGYLRELTEGDEPGVALTGWGSNR
jgi:hypothetical protein